MQNTLAAILCLALAVGALFMWQPWADAAEVTPDARIPTPVASPEAVEPKLVAAAPKTAEQPRRTEVVAEPTTEAEPRGPVLRVIDGVTGEPIGQPVVRYLGASKIRAEFGERSRLTGFMSAQFYRLMERTGEELRGDALGQVRLPPAEEPFVVGYQVAAKSGLARGRNNEDQPLVLEVYPDHDLKVLVQDHQGIPQSGVPVALTVENSPGYRSAFSEVVTGADGTTAMTQWRQMSRLFGGAVENPAVAVEIALPLAEPSTFDLDPLSPPVEPVVLTLPATGSVEVRFDHPDQSAFEGAEVALRPTGTKGKAESRHDAQSTGENGRAVFERVGLGMELYVSARLRSARIAAERLKISGPESPGQRIFVTLKSKVGNPVILAQLRDDSGQLLRSTRLKVRRSANQGNSTSRGSGSERTDKDGRVRMEVRDHFDADAERSLEFVLEGAPGKVVKVSLPTIYPGENDLGVLTLLPPPLICSGTVTDLKGEVVVDASIQIHRKVPVPRSANGYNYRGVRLPTIKTDEAGKFVVAGVVDHAEHVISVRSNDHLPINFEPFGMGATGLLLVMGSAASLSGKLVFDGEVVPRHWEVVVEHQEKDRANKEPGEGGEFRFTSLRPGMADVRVRMFGDPHPVFERAGVVLRAGEETELGEIDLQNRFHSITFHVQGNDGRPADGVAALVMHEGNQKFEGAFVDDGSATVMSRAETVNLVLYSESDPDYRSLRVDGVRDGQKIVMAKAHEVVVQLPPGVRLPGGGTTLGISLWPRDANPQATRGPMSVNIRGRSQTSSSSGSGEPPWIQPGHDTFDGSVPAVVRVMSSGKYSVGLTLSNAEGRGVGVDGPEQTVEIPAGQDRISATAMITQHALDEALAELRK